MNNREEMARAEKAKYQREWRAKNRDKVREINARYWAKRAERAAAAAREDEENEN